jgi:hypothetical protein
VKSADADIVYSIQVKVSGNSKKLIISDPEQSKAETTKALYL